MPMMWPGPARWREQLAARSLGAGTYQSNCAACHGPDRKRLAAGFSVAG